jgi:hypothetical protein
MNDNLLIATVLREVADIVEGCYGEPDELLFRMFRIRADMLAPPENNETK